MKVYLCSFNRLSPAKWRYAAQFCHLLFAKESSAVHFRNCLEDAVLIIYLSLVCLASAFMLVNPFFAVHSDS